MYFASTYIRWAQHTHGQEWCLLSSCRKNLTSRLPIPFPSPTSNINCCFCLALVMGWSQKLVTKKSVISSAAPVLVTRLTCIYVYNGGQQRLSQEASSGQSQGDARDTLSTCMALSTPRFRVTLDDCLIESPAIPPWLVNVGLTPITAWRRDQRHVRGSITHHSHHTTSIKPKGNYAHTWGCQHRTSKGISLQR